MRCLNASIERATLHPRQPLRTHVLSLTPATLAASSATGTSIPFGFGFLRGRSFRSLHCCWELRTAVEGDAARCMTAALMALSPSAQRGA